MREPRLGETRLLAAGCTASASGSRLQLLRTENDPGGQRGAVVWATRDLAVCSYLEMLFTVLF